MTAVQTAAPLTMRVGKFALDATHLDVTGVPDFDEWQGFGAYLQGTEQAIQWWVGDWLLYGEAHFGEAFSQAIQETGWKASTLKVYQWVCERVDPSRRRPDLTFWHHRVVAKLEPPDQDLWLAKALTGDHEGPWPTEKLRHHMKRAVDFEAVTHCWLKVDCENADDRDALKQRLEAEGRTCKIVK